MSLAYFFEAGTDGNLSLSSITKRVDDASKVFENGMAIELDNGVTCSSREELFVAVSQASIDSYKKPKQQNTAPENSTIIVGDKKMSTASKIILVFVIGIFVLILVWILNWYLY